MPKVVMRTRPTTNDQRDETLIKSGLVSPTPKLIFYTVHRHLKRLHKYNSIEVRQNLKFRNLTLQLATCTADGTFYYNRKCGFHKKVFFILETSDSRSGQNAFFVEVLCHSFLKMIFWDERFIVFCLMPDGLSSLVRPVWRRCSIKKNFSSVY